MPCYVQVNKYLIILQHKLQYSTRNTKAFVRVKGKKRLSVKVDFFRNHQGKNIF